MCERLEVLVDCGDLCGECPTWDAENSRIIWTDVSGSLLRNYRFSGGTWDVIYHGIGASGVTMNHDGKLVLASTDGLHLLDEKTGEVRAILADDGDRKWMFNDIVADAAGRVYAGTYYWGEDGMDKMGGLYLVDHHGDAQMVDDGIQLANGLSISPDNRRLYFSDSAARQILVYDVEPNSGTLSAKRVLIELSEDDGLPDGLAVDSEGYVWCATWYGGQVLRVDPDGAVERRVVLPVKQTSSVAFGGAEMTDLIITSAAEFWPSPFQPSGLDETAAMGGALYLYRGDIAGKPEHHAQF